MKVYLDNILLEHEPLGLGTDEFSEVIELDLSLHGYVQMFEFELTFIKDGFEYIYEKKKQNGYCSRIEVRIENPSPQGTNVVTGFFFLTDCSFNHTDKTVKTEITDSTYGVFISESKSLKISPAATVTRSGNVLVPVPETDVTVYTPSTGVDLVPDAKMYELAPTVEHMIKYLSDNGLDFAQTYFTPEFNFFLSSPYFLRNRGSANIPDVQFSFEELMTQLFKLFGIWFKVNNSTIPATFTLVQGEENFFGTYNGIELPDIRNLIEEFYHERFFATVEVGDTEAIIERDTTYQLPTVPLVGFKEEVYNAASDCTLDNTLDLKSEWIIDHNLIEKIVTVGDDNERPVILYVDENDNAYKGTYGVTGNARYYNEELLNFKVLARHNMPSDLNQALGADTDGFVAYLGTDDNITVTTATYPYPFDTETSDPGNNYDNVLFRYIAPESGSYKFVVNLEYIVNDLQLPAGGFPGSGRVDIDVTIYRRQTGTGTILQSETVNIVHLTPTGANVTQQIFLQVFADATDYIDARVDVTFQNAGANNDVTILGQYVGGGSYFATVFTFNNGGTVDTTSLIDYRASALKFSDYPIPLDKWNRLKQDPSQGIYINNGGNNTLCWVKRIKRNLKTGKSECEMLSSSLLTQL